MTDEAPRKPKGLNRTPEEVRSWLSTQGYALEHGVRDDFLGQPRQYAGQYTADLGRGYVDGVEGKLRDIDVLVEAHIRRSAVRFLIAIECKTSYAAWVVRRVALGGDDEPQWQIPATPRMRDFQAAQGWKWASLFAVNSRSNLNFAIVAAGGPDLAYEAVAQAVSGAWGAVSEVRQAAIALPMVVLDGPLMSATYRAGDLELNEEEWVRLVWSLAPTQRGGPRLPVLVDVVTKAAVPKYAQALLHTFDSVGWAISDAKFDAALPDP